MAFLNRITQRFKKGQPAPVLPDWRELLTDQWPAWEEARAQAQAGPPVLLATGVGGHLPVAVFDGLLAAALTMRGARVQPLLCDGLMPACELLTIHSLDEKGVEDFARRGVDRAVCGRCFEGAARMYRSLGLEPMSYSQWVGQERRREMARLAGEISLDEIGSYSRQGLKVGEHALAGALRFFARGDLGGEPLGEKVLRHYFEASLLAASALGRLFEEQRFECASFHHGIYVPQGIVGECARKAGVRVANWQVAYRKKTFIFSHGDTYHHTMLTEPVEAWQNMDWGPGLEKEILSYLASRIHGTRDWIYFHESPKEDLDEIVGRLGLDVEKPWVGLLTNVLWDAQLHYPANAFSGMKEWVLATIDYFSKRPEVQLVIRIHPAEVRGAVPSRQLITEEIASAFGGLAPNIFVIGPESDISTYTVMGRCDAVLIYGTKTGVELTCQGVPVIVGGEAWIRGKGLTMDAAGEKEYFQILDRLPLGKPLSDETMRLARMYAFHFFYRRMIPVGAIEPRQGKPPLGVSINGLDSLRPGADPGLDVICRGIMDGSDFIYPAERYLKEGGKV